MRIHTPSSTLTRPANTTAYAANDLVASSTTAGSIVVPSFTAVPVGGMSGYIERIRLATNKTSGMASINFTVRLWSEAPTYTNGDNGAYAVATNEDALLGTFTTAGMLQGATGASVEDAPDIGTRVGFNLSSASRLIYWDLEIESTLTPASAQTFTITPEIYLL